MSIFVIHNSHELHQLKKSLAPPPGRYDYLSALSFQLKQKNHSHFCCASFPLRGAWRFLLSIFREKLPKYVAVDPLLLSIHSSIARESKMEVHNEEKSILGTYIPMFIKQIIL